ncbi:MAG TPA: ATP-binding protein [Gaiellaceae bacterium]
MTRRLLFSYLGLALLVLAVLEIPLGIVNARNERTDLETKVERDASFLAAFSEDTLENHTNPRALAVAATDYSAKTGGRVVIVKHSGVAIIDTNSPAPGHPRTFATRPEIRAALRGGVSTGIRYSKTLHQRLLYVAVPASSGTRVTGAVRITYPTSSVDSRILRYRLMLLAIGGLVLVAATLVGLRFARWVSAPLARLETVTAEAGAGDLTTRAKEEGPPEVRSLAASFNHMISELEQLVRSQEEFVADASHQLRTPLTALRLRLENLGGEATDSVRLDLEPALEEVERLSRLVAGLLALARAEVSSPERVDLAKLVDGRIDAWSALAAEREVKLEANVSGVALAGRDRLAQALENLLSNALAVSPPGATVTVSGYRGELHVTDQGPGMSAVQRERAFDRFWRGGESGTGSGLGLAIVKRLIEIDGGQVELRAAPGGGLDAVIRLRTT